MLTKTEAEIDEQRTLLKKLQQELSTEEAYFLPATADYVRSYPNTEDNLRLYTRLCVYGMNVIAKTVAASLAETGKITPLFELYKYAARIRFQIAMLHNSENKAPFGEPEFGQMIDHIIPGEKGRVEGVWREFFKDVSDVFDKVYNGLEKEAKIPESIQQFSALRSSFLSQWIANDQDVITGYDTGIVMAEDGNRLGTEKDFQSLTLNRVAHEELVENGEFAEYAAMKAPRYSLGSIRKSPDSDQIHFFHMKWEDRKIAFADADYIMADMVGFNLEMDWNKYKELSQLLFHIGACERGGQATNLMVLAGIVKGMGYPIDRRSTKTDSFIDMMITAPKANILDLNDIPVQGIVHIKTCIPNRDPVSFIRKSPPKTSSPDKIKEIDLGPDPFENIDWSKRYKNSNFNESLNRALSIWYEKPFPHFNATATVREGKVALKVMYADESGKIYRGPDSIAQKRADYYLDWLGDELFCKAYGISKDKTNALCR